MMMLNNRNNFNKITRLGRNRKKFIYTKKTYANPFFRHKNTRTVEPGLFPTKTKLSIFAAITIVAILIWLLFFSTLFKINNIGVSGVNENMTKEVETIARQLAENRIIGKNNLLLYNKNELIKTLNEKYYLSDLTVKRKLLHTLTIELHEKQQAAVWVEDGQYYYIDGEGKTINQVDPLNINGAYYPIIENQTDIKISDRQTNVNKETIDYITKLFAEFKDKKHNFDIEKFIVDKDANTAKIAVLSGPKIYFNIKTPVEEQAAKLDLVIKEKFQNGFQAVKEYIDLRYANNVYIK